jgi:hypothetical protein
MGDATSLHLLANLSDRAIADDQGPSIGTIIWGSGLTGTHSPWSVHWRLGTP